MKKVANDIGLVLEGGGFRGCYTAGALKWLLDNEIEMPYTAAISATAAYAFQYIAKKPDEMFDLSAVGVTDKHFVGLSAMIHEKSIVGYQYLFDKCFRPNYQENLQRVRESHQIGEVGAFNMTTQQLEYTDMRDLDENGDLLVAACTLPVSGPMKTVGGNKWLDGGIDTMVSTKRSKATGHPRNLVIVTKDKNYVRKDNPWFLKLALKLEYHKYPKMLEILSGRVAAYYSQMQEVYDDQAAGNAILIRPTRDCGVKRFTGTKETLKAMFDLGYQDMEDQKEAIYKFLGISQEEEKPDIPTPLKPENFKKPLRKPLPKPTPDFKGRNTKHRAKKTAK